MKESLHFAGLPRRILAQCNSAWAVLDRAGRGWRGVVQTPAAVRLLQDLRRQLLHPSAIQEVITEAVIPAA